MKIELIPYQDHYTSHLGNHIYCSTHKTDICITPCEACKKLLDELLKKYNILNCEM
jgi:cytidine deaminase